MDTGSSQERVKRRPACRPARRLDSPARTAQSDRMIATMSRPAAAAGPAGHLDLPALLSRPYPAVMGVLNVTPEFIFRRRAVRRTRTRAGAGPADGRRGRRHHRHRRGIHPALRLGADLGGRGTEAVGAGAAGCGCARRSRLDRQHEIGRRRLGAGSGRRDRQRRLGPAARSRHGRPGRRARKCPSSSCTTATAPIPPSTS